MRTPEETLTLIENARQEIEDEFVDCALKRQMLAELESASDKVEQPDEMNHHVWRVRAMWWIVRSMDLLKPAVLDKRRREREDRPALTEWAARQRRRMTERADALESNLEDALLAKAEVEAERDRLQAELDAISHARKCRDCGNVARHVHRVTPYVNCRRCNSMDTRPTKQLPPPPANSVLVNEFIKIHDPELQATLTISARDVVKMIGLAGQIAPHEGGV